MELDPAVWPASDARALVSRIAASRRLVERFVIRQRRHKRTVGGLELSLDEVEVRRVRRLVGRLTELEVELKAGPRSRLLALGRELELSGLVRPEIRSKMAIAAELVARSGSRDAVASI